MNWKRMCQTLMGKKCWTYYIYIYILSDNPSTLAFKKVFRIQIINSVSVPHRAQDYVGKFDAEVDRAVYRVWDNPGIIWYHKCISLNQSTMLPPKHHALNAVPLSYTVQL